MLTHAWLDELRRPWRRERAQASMPEGVAAGPDTGDRDQVGELLRALGPRQRAVVVLRFYCDMPVSILVKDYLLSMSKPDGTGIFITTWDTNEVALT